MRHKKAHALLVLSLCVSLLATGCNSDWISVALDDLPLLTQMALNIGSLATTLQSGQQLSASERPRSRTFRVRPAKT